MRPPSFFGDGTAAAPLTDESATRHPLRRTLPPAPCASRSASPRDPVADRTACRGTPLGATRRCSPSGQQVHKGMGSRRALLETRRVARETVTASGAEHRPPTGLAETSTPLTPISAHSSRTTHPDAPRLDRRQAAASPVPAPDERRTLERVEAAPKKAAGDQRCAARQQFPPPSGSP